MGGGEVTKQLRADQGEGAKRPSGGGYGRGYLPSTVRDFF